MDTQSLKTKNRRYLPKKCEEEPQLNRNRKPINLGEELMSRQAFFGAKLIDCDRLKNQYEVSLKLLGKKKVVYIMKYIEEEMIHT